MDLISYLQIPYLHQGRTARGADCFGLLRLYYQQELGIELPDFTENYPQEWWTSKNYFLELYQEYGFRRVKQPQPHDLIMFRNTATKVGHIGIVLDDNSFLHMCRQGCSTSNYLFGVWARQVHSVYRYCGVPR